MPLVITEQAIDGESGAGGILPAHAISRLIDEGCVLPGQPVMDGQIQPASLDLRLGMEATRVRASFLPGPGVSVAEKLERFALHAFDLAEG
ncbi:MAG: 2'-deoxycytidine 5'-triphosphate deaminase, partial [Proteobacteria bacterium]|nr:2'-deoxycytidine 5'-triphosphate deaminase [Pseudomonadota bacterium]